jgi:MSHA pilin protein MshA
MTLVELVIVIIILGLLATIVFPKFIDLSQDAESTAIKSIAGALSTSNAENYAFRMEKATNGVPISNCTSASNLLQGGLPSGYSITSLAIAVNVSSTCTLNGPSAGTATFTATGIA